MTVNRLAVFFHYDENAAASSYVYEYLRALKSIAGRVVFVNNGPLDDLSCTKVREIADDCLLRENTGYDSWAYKHALEHVGWQTIATFDEVILCNFTAYAPVGDLMSMFETMDARQNDFWGAAKHGEYLVYFLPRRKGYCHEHIMSYFMVFRKPVITSSAFSSYWAELPLITSYFEAVGLHETVFTGYLERHGFASDTYVDLASTESVSPNASVYQAEHFLMDLACPVVKRKAFFHDYADLYRRSPARQGSKILRYTSETGCYDQTLIWEDMLRTQDIYALMRNLHLRHIIPRELSFSEADLSGALRDSVLVVHIESGLVAQSICANLRGRRLPDRVEVHFASHALREEYGDSLRATVAASSRVSMWHAGDDDDGTWVSAFVASLERADDDDLMCFMSLEPPEHPDALLLGTTTGFQEVVESLLGSDQSVLYIHRLFGKNERLGLLIPYPPVHAHQDPRGIPVEGVALDATRSALADLPLRKSFEPRKKAEYFIKPARCFWVRKKCLAAADTEALVSQVEAPDCGLICQALLPALAQRNSYYTALVATEEQCAAYLDNLQYLYEYGLRFRLGHAALIARNERLAARVRQTGLRAVFYDLREIPVVLMHMVCRWLHLPDSLRDPKV